MTLKLWTLGSLTFLLLAFNWGCNNKTKSGGIAANCPIGMVATPAGCTYPGNLTPPVGYISPGNGMIQYYASKTDFLTQKDTLFPTSEYASFLKNALGVCDQCYYTDGEALVCDSWVRGFNMLMVSLSPTLSTNNQMSFYTTPAIKQSYFQYAWQFPKIEDFFISLFTGVPAPSCKQAQFSPYWATDVAFETHNDQNGFVLYVNQGPFYSVWNRHKFRLYVPQGKIGDPSFSFTLTAIDGNGNAANLATGTLTRCMTPNCQMF